MPTGFELQQHSDEVTAPLQTLIELYASQGQRLGSLSRDMAKLVSALEHLSGHIGERLDQARMHSELAEAAAICARAKIVTPSGDPSAVEPISDQRGNTTTMGLVYPARAYGATHPSRRSLAAPISLPDADLRLAKCGNVVLVVGSGRAAYSADGGNTLIPLDPTTTFPPCAVGGLCLNQAAQYLPSIDRFVWLMHFRAGTGGQHCLRMAAASPREIICTRCTGWTYWDLSALLPGFNQGMSSLEVSVRHDVLGVGIGERKSDRSIVEVPLDAIRAGGPIHWRVSLQPNSACFRANPLQSVRGQG